MQGEAPPPGMQPLPAIPVVERLPGVDGPKRINFDVPFSLVNPIKATWQRAVDLIDSPETRMLVFGAFGKSQMKMWKASPDGVVQMAMQAAYYKLYGKLGATYESCATRSFFHGRTEVIRSAHDVGKAFAQSLFSDSMPRGEKAQLLRTALAWQGQISKEAAQGQGVDRHLLALKKLAMGITSHSPPLASLLADTSKLPAFFREDPYALSQTWLLSTSNVTVRLPSIPIPSHSVPTIQYHISHASPAVRSRTGTSSSILAPCARTATASDTSSTTTRSTSTSPHSKAAPTPSRCASRRRWRPRCSRSARSWPSPAPVPHVILADLG